jgi:excisionase family DNA binding protein
VSDPVPAPMRAWQVADLLGVCVETVLRWTRAGTLPAYRIGRAWRYDRAEILAWRDARATGERVGDTGREVSPTRGATHPPGEYAPLRFMASPTPPRDPRVAPTERTH